MNINGGMPVRSAGSSGGVDANTRLERTRKEREALRAEKAKPNSTDWTCRGLGGYWLQPWRFGHKEKKDSATIFFGWREIFLKFGKSEEKKKGEKKKRKIMWQGLLTCPFILTIRLYQGLRLELLHLVQYPRSCTGSQSSSFIVGNLHRNNSNFVV